MGERGKPLLGLTLGEAPGIGPELIVKALQSSEINSMATWVLIGDERVLKQAEEITGLHVNYNKIDNIDEVNDGNKVWFIDLQNLDPDSYTHGVLNVDSGKITGETLKFALNLAQSENLDGVVYAPLNKEALHRGGFNFKDEIHFFASLLNCDSGFGEVNKLDDLYVTRVTSHIPLSDVAKNITKENVKRVIHFANNIVTQAGGTPKIAVAGLNPHAGDGGLMGREELDVIIPAVEEAKAEGINVDGPFPSDTINLRIRDESYNSLVGMYHDQVQIGMKLLGFFRGVTISGGLPVILTTPAHGTAFDIAGKGIADSGAMEQAMKVAVTMVRNKKEQTTA